MIPCNEAIESVRFSELFAVPIRSGLFRPTHVRGQGVKMVNMGEIFSHGRIGNIEMELVPLAESEHERFLVKKNDLLFARRSLAEGAGKCCIFIGDDATTFESDVIRVRLNQELADARFYFYFFNSQKGKRLMETIVEKTAASGIRTTDLSNLVVPKPERDLQRQIGDFLELLDHKIEINRKLNTTLEVIARAIFKSWFIDFDPVRAKMEGRTPYGMDEEPLALFPDSFEDSELGEIPKGWNVGRLDKEYIVTMGQSPPGETYNEYGNGVPFYQGRVDFGARFPKHRVYCTSPKRMAKDHDTLITVRAPVGDINMVLEGCCIGRGVAAVRHKNGSYSYTYYSMNSIKEQFRVFEAEGTVFGAMGKDDLGSIKVLIPPKRVIERFNKFIIPFDEMIELLTKQSITLSLLRDLLLPKLISGEIRIKPQEEVEKV